MTKESIRSARFPWRDGNPIHLPCRPGAVPRSVLIPGDPDRVAIAAAVLDGATDLGRRREFAMARGTWEGTPVAVCSSGIGGPSTEIAAIELVHLGEANLIRVGGMGAVDASLALGSFVIVERATGGTGTARLYGALEGGVAADEAVVGALEQAALQLGLPYRRGVIHTADSYYWGQERPTSPDAPVPPAREGLIERLTAEGIAGIDMEAEALFAVARAVGARAGAVLAVHGHRVTDRWLEDYDETQRNLIRLAATAAAILETDNREEPSP
ncbi:MAG: nucleoside phosphorylase [Burkholderiales bacterium]|nr:nucleoside phosphorylase [Burkholderiales bacterium]